MFKLIFIVKPAEDLALSKYQFYESLDVFQFDMAFKKLKMVKLMFWEVSLF